MMTVRRAGERGTSRLGWLDSYHTFSFADYYDPQHMGYRALRVINDDTVAPGGGFGTHGHRDMEIVTYVLDGALEHKDSLGSGSVIRPGDVQKMSAGSGILHSEFNYSRDEPVHFLQIWILPARQGITPGYQQVNFPRETKIGQLTLVAAGEDLTGVIRLEQDARMYVSVLETPGHQVEHALASARHAWVQVARGQVTVNGERLTAGDGAAIAHTAVAIGGAPSGEVLLFDLA